jgi:pimeloyl-ACP methyl ester carboxylesterase
MNRYLMLAALAAPVACVAGDCEAISQITLANTTITSAKAMLAGPLTAGRGQSSNVPAFCQVHGIIKPSSVSAIHFEAWMPEAGWNGSLEVAGNGGLAGTISTGPMAAALRNGFAAASTDTGHTTQEPREWLEDRERLIDYSYRGLHLTVENAKAIVKAYYTQNAKASYFIGCSYGGKQALTEAQRFPADFDGIVAGDAANYWTHQMLSEVWNGVVTSSLETNLSADKLEIVQNAAMLACDANDGISDGIISDPQHCHFDPKKLLCAGADTSKCLTAAELGAVEKMYTGPVNPRTHAKLYPGLYPGGEVGWGRAGGQMVINRTNSSGVSSNDFFRFALFKNPDWQFRTLDFDRDAQAVDEELAGIMNATDPNLEEFRKLGHKLIYYHGTADPLIPAQNGIDYYETVVKAQKGLEKAQTFYRVFLVPGLYHCSGGPGPIAIGTSQPPPVVDADHDVLTAAIRWVEKGVAPDKIIGTKYVNGSPANGVALQRPLCMYPAVAKYKGSGDIKDANSFTCAKP